MVIVGTYPDLADVTPETHLTELKVVLDGLLPSDATIHLLPLYPSSGDGGFAPDDWYRVRTELGEWGHVRQWALSRKLILDGVYNHVGRNHLFAHEFFAGPTEDGPLYAYRSDAPPSAQTSPRGGSVFRPHLINGSTWHLWQTFSKDSFDIRIAHPRVRSEISRHLAFLAKTGISGVRLDGCAYYGHRLDEEQFHNSEGKALTHDIVRAANDAGLFVIAQLDADPAGASYFPRNDAWSVPVVDYAYSAVLVLALLSQSAREMAQHVERTKTLPCDALRPPRTHDGILLQSDLLTQRELDLLGALARHWALPVRIANDEPYEINSSFPFLCGLGVGSDQAWRRILLSLALTAFLPGIPYFYLPMLVQHVPEKGAAHQDNDPRSLNRTRLSLDFLSAFASSSRRHELHSLLTAILSIRSTLVHGALTTSITGGPHDDSALMLHNPEQGWTFACNLSAAHSIHLSIAPSACLHWGDSAVGSKLGPLGFGLWTTPDCPVRIA